MFEQQGLLTEQPGLDTKHGEFQQNFVQKAPATVGAKGFSLKSFYL